MNCNEQSHKRLDDISDGLTQMGEEIHDVSDDVGFEQNARAGLRVFPF